MWDYLFGLSSTSLEVFGSSEAAERWVDTSEWHQLFLQSDGIPNDVQLFLLSEFGTITPRTKPALSVTSTFAAIAVLKIENGVTLLLLRNNFRNLFLDRIGFASVYAEGQNVRWFGRWNVVLSSACANCELIRFTCFIHLKHIVGKNFVYSSFVIGNCIFKGFLMN